MAASQKAKPAQQLGTIQENIVTKPISRHQTKSDIATKNGGNIYGPSSYNQLRRNSLNDAALSMATSASRRSSIDSTTSARRYSLDGRGRWASPERRASFQSMGKFSSDAGKTLYLYNKPENSYQLEPENDEKFNVTKVKKLLEEILEIQLNGKVYDPLTASAMTMTLTEHVKDKVKLLGFHRHKLVVYIVLCPNMGQDIEIASRCVWDENYDNFASASYHGKGLCAVAMTFGLYYD